MKSLRLHLNWLSGGLLAFVVLSSAQTPLLFQWRFVNNDFSTSLPTCVTLPIEVIPLNKSTNTIGTPPYYMIAFVVGGTPVTTFIGTEPDKLNWEITEPVGSKLLLHVVDANGGSGGTPPNIHTIISGQTTQCVTTPLATPKFEITTNVTGELSTCQPWGFGIEGGVPPYTITLLAVNSGPHVTNATIGFGDDAFTFINRVPPGSTLLGSVSDFTGRWADGTAIINTTGSDDTDCTGLVSSSGSSPPIIHRTGHINQRVTLIVGVSMMLLLGLSVAGFLYLRNRRKQTATEFDDTSARPYPFSGSEAVILSINHYLTSTPGQAPSSRKIIMPRINSPKLPSTPSLSSTSASNHTRAHANQSLGDRPFSVSNYSPVDDAQASLRSMYSTPSFTNFPLTSIRGAVNPGGRASSDEADIYHSELGEPALSDKSNVLPRSIRYSAARTSRSGTVLVNSRHNSEDTRVLRDLPPPYPRMR